MSSKKAAAAAKAKVGDIDEELLSLYDLIFMGALQVTKEMNTDETKTPPLFLVLYIAQAVKPFAVGSPMEKPLSRGLLNHSCLVIPGCFGGNMGIKSQKQANLAYAMVCKLEEFLNEKYGKKKNQVHYFDEISLDKSSLYGGLEAKGDYGERKRVRELEED